ncbi:MAG: hypothetical protein V1888_02020, partial [archaeon]
YLGILVTSFFVESTNLLRNGSLFILTCLFLINSCKSSYFIMVSPEPGILKTGFYPVGNSGELRIWGTN